VNYKLTKLAFVMALIVVTLGALTRLLDAGLGCPDWPGCYGQIIPPSSEEHDLVHQGKAWMEMIHRYVATALGAVILVIALAVQSTPNISNKIKWMSRFLLALVIVQGLFGMWTVTLKLLPQVVTLHLLGGMAVLSTIFLLLLMLKQPTVIATPNKPKFLSLAVLLLLSVQIALGGWTSSTYSGLACTDFPTCDGHFLPPMDIAQSFHLTEFSDRNYEGGLLDPEERVTIQYTHRVMALILFIAIFSLFLQLRKTAAFRSKANILLGLTFLQISIGIGTAVLMLPLSLALLHNTGAALLLLSVVHINYTVFSTQNTLQQTDSTANS
jgi:cytochrome c oxidase assembly protein subunit 15